MRLSTRSRYGIRALTALAAHELPDGRCARELADEEDLSKKYLESILAQLRTAGIVRSVRGAHGGYVLAHDPAELTVADVVRVLEGSLAFVECVDDASYCERSTDCVTRHVWIKAEQALSSAFKGITIQGLVDRRKTVAEEKPAE
jgi:Rrf2 family transcriptional regulator, cysteine metabolism repressor